MAQEETFVRFPKAISFWQKKYLWFQNRIAKRPASRNDFAAWLDISSANLSYYSNGYRAPNMESTIKLAPKLGVEIYDIYSQPMLIPNNEVYKRVNHMLGELSNKEQEQVIAILEAYVNQAHQNDNEMLGDMEPNPT